MKLFIDGDGSPVKEDVIKLEESYGLDVVIVASMDHYTTKEYANHVQIAYVDCGADSAGCKIVGMVEKNGLLVTQNYGLASFVLPEGVRVFHHSGRESDEASIGMLLEQHHRSGRLRKTGIRTKGPKPSTEEDYMSSRQAPRKTTD